MNLLDALMEDHKKIKTVMDSIEVSADKSDDSCDKYFQEFKKLFNVHDKIEDEIVYPKLLQFPELKKLVRKAYQAHHVVEVAILELRLTPYSSENWLAKFSVMHDGILKHIEEEEEMIFPKAKELIDNEAMTEMTIKANKVREKNE